MAIKSTHFCKSAGLAVSFILRNCLRFAAVKGLGSLFIFIGKIFVTLVTALCGFFILTKSEPWKTSVKSPLAPVLLIVVISYLTSRIFMAVWSMAFDSLMMAYV